MSVHYGDIVNLATQRIRPGQIAQRLNIDADVVYAQIRKARKIGIDIPHFSRRAPSKDIAAKASGVPAAPVNSTAIVIPNRLHSLLASEAERCGKTQSELAENLLEAGLLNRVSRHG